jgi:hypothetical protein
MIEQTNAMIGRTTENSEIQLMAAMAFSGIGGLSASSGQAKLRAVPTATTRQSQ